MRHVWICLAAGIAAASLFALIAQILWHGQYLNSWRFRLEQWTDRMLERIVE